MMARRSSEVWTTSGSRPASRQQPRRRVSASVRPLSDSGTSTQPVNRFFAFQSLSPWRSRTRVYVMAARLVRACRVTWPDGTPGVLELPSGQPRARGRCQGPAPLCTGPGLGP